MRRLLEAVDSDILEVIDDALMHDSGSVDTSREGYPDDILFEMLDRLLYFNKDDEGTLEIDMIHTLHGLRLMGDYLRDIVNQWVEISMPKWKKFQAHR